MKGRRRAQVTPERPLPERAEREGSAEGGGQWLRSAAKFRKDKDGTEVLRSDNQVTGSTHGSLWDASQILRAKQRE